MRASEIAKSGGAPAMRLGWPDAIRLKMDRWMLQPTMYRRALSNPLTRWITRRRTRQLFDVMAGFVHSQVLLTCVRLNLFSIVGQAPATLAELAERTGIAAPALQRLLLSAVAVRLLQHRSGGRFGLGPLGAPIAAHEGVAAMVEHNNLLYQDMGDPVAFLRHAWGGQMAAYWPYAHTDKAGQQGALDPGQVGRYSALMAASQNFVVEEILATYPFAEHRSVLDVGCGKGRFVAELAQRQKHLTFQLFDLPPVLALTRQNHASLGLESRMQYHGGSFFDDALPQGSDLVTLVRVAHDHPDDAVRAILKKIFEALPAGGRLLLAEPMAQEPGEKPLADAYYHYYLLAMGAGRLRTASELVALMQDSGFRQVERLSNAMPIHAKILVGRKPG
jgi:demethylspheroidene O-methyltransferase